MFYGLRYLGENGDSELNSLNDDWMEIEVTVDSGACDTVMPAKFAEPIKLHTPNGTHKHPGYEAANGTTIHNIGERRCLISPEGGTHDKIMHFQVADIRKPLLSITKIADMGFECVLGKYGGRVWKLRRSCLGVVAVVFGNYGCHALELRRACLRITAAVLGNADSRVWR